MTAVVPGRYVRMRHQGGNTVTFRVDDAVEVTRPDYYPAANGWSIDYVGVEHPDTKTPTDMVREFHEVFGAPIAPPGYRGLGDEQLRRLRAELIREEFVDELLPALGLWLSSDSRAIKGAATLGVDSRVEVADALGDLVYVIYGAALSFGIDLDAVVTEIHRSNMTKLGADGKPIYREGDMKVLKGPNYERPNIARVLEQGS